MRSLAVVLVVIACGAAHADPQVDGGEPAPSEARPHEVYVEALGKGHVWGLGYHYSIDQRFGIGAVASYTVLDGAQRMVAFAPYGSVRILGEHHHRWFADLGPEIVYLQTPSPVMEWSGTSSTGIGGELSSGYEYRDHFLFRIYGEVVAGTHGSYVAPWLGSSVGWTF